MEQVLNGYITNPQRAFSQAKPYPYSTPNPNYNPNQINLKN